MLLDQNIRVLIVDDDPKIVRLLSRFVDEMSLEVVSATQPREALRLAAEQPIHIAVIDLHMPEMEGIELMKSLHRVNDDMEVILMTGDRSSDRFSEAIQNGAYDFIWKPIDFSHLGNSLTAARSHVLRRAAR